MTHLEIRYVVNGRIESTDSTLLDTIESELPDEGDPVLGNEYDLSRSPVLDDSGNETGAEVLSGRMTFATSNEMPDDASQTPKEAAEALYNQVVSSDLAANAENWEVVLYRTPEGAVLSKDVQAWYEENPNQQPTDEDGEPYVPSSWDPTFHELKREDTL